MKLGLMAGETVVLAVEAPGGVGWGKEVAFRMGVGGVEEPGWGRLLVPGGGFLADEGSFLWILLRKCREEGGGLT